MGDRAELSQSPDRSPEAPTVSVVIAVLNEVDNVEAVTAGVLTAMDPGPAFELIFVDDGSTDATATAVARLALVDDRVRLLRHDRRCGKSQALRTGVTAARGGWIGTLDGDGQNDARDIAEMLDLALAVGEPWPLVAGVRLRRDDPLSRLIATRVANGFRQAVLGDHCPDTGCGVKLFRREDFLRMPMFEGMHRFLPALFQRYGHPMICKPVRHYARLRGVSKYTNWGRALVGVIDLLGVIWLTRRTHAPSRVIEG